VGSTHFPSCSCSSDACFSGFLGASRNHCGCVGEKKMRGVGLLVGGAVGEQKRAAYYGTSRVHA
jgi:hypothetical protein